MKRCVSITVFLLFGVCVPSGLFSQADHEGSRATSSFQDTIQSNFGSIAFDKSLNTYHWAAISYYKNRFGPDSVQMREQFLSTLIRSDRKLITDNQTFDLRAVHRITNNLSASAKISSFINSD